MKKYKTLTYPMNIQTSYKFVHVLSVRRQKKNRDGSLHKSIFVYQHAYHFESNRISQGHLFESLIFDNIFPNITWNCPK